MRSLTSTIKLLQRLQSAGSAAEATGPAAAPALSCSLLARGYAAPAVQGDAAGVLREIDRIVTSETAGAKEVSDAAVALAYLQAKDNRRLWGKVFEKVPAVQAGFDAASLSSFLWAATTAGVSHFKTLAELSGPAAALLPSLSPAQLSLVVEGLGKAGAKDEQFLASVAAKVSADAAAFKPAELARLLWGFAAAGVENGALVKAASKALASKAGELSGREACQAVWGLAKLRHADKASLDALVGAATKKLDSAVDAAGLAWALGFLGYPADAAATQAVAAKLKAGATTLSAAHAVDAAWGLGLLGGDKGGDKDAVSALFAHVAAAVEAAPDVVDPYQLASLYEAAALTPTAKLPDQVLAYAGKMHALVEEGARAKRSAGLTHFKEQLAQAVARATGARYRPEITAKVAGFAVTTPDGVHVDCVVEVEGSKLAVEGVGAHYLSSAGTPLGPARSRAKLLQSKGFTPVLVPANEFMAQQDPMAAAKLVLAKIKAAPGLASKVRALEAKLNEPFDPYA